MSNTLSILANDAKQKFLSENADLVALLQNGAGDLFNRISADLAMDEEAEVAMNDPDGWASGVDHEASMARDICRTGWKQDFYKQLCLSFLRLRARGAINLVVTDTNLPQEAKEQLYQVEVDAGCHPKRSAQDPVKVALTDAQFDESIVNDWKNLPTAEIAKKRKADSRYNARLVEMLDSGALV